jgi:hypothetical protein
MCPADCRDGREGEREKRECERERDIKRERERLLVDCFV